MQNLNPIEELIHRWPSRREFADDVGANLEAVHKWAKTGRIPSKRQHSVVMAAAARGMSDVTPGWLVMIHSANDGGFA